MRLFLVMAVTIFMAEVAAMLILGSMPGISPQIEIVIDSTLLVLFVSPALYFFLFNPLTKMIKKSEEMAGRVLHLSYMPEDDPDPIFEINLKSQKVSYLNKSAREQFPELGAPRSNDGGVAVDWDHPLFISIKSMAEEFIMDDEGKALDVMEAKVGGGEGPDSYRVYDRKLRYIPHQNILRIYTVDITRQEKLATITQRLLVEVKEIKNELENEHREAEEIGNLLLKSEPSSGGIVASVRTEPCSKAGGDRAGFITRVSPEDGKTEEWLALFDASGHGKGAAKFQEVAMGGLLALIGAGAGMAEALKSVNRTLEGLGTGRFLVGNIFRLVHEDEKEAESGWRSFEEFNIAQHNIIALGPDENQPGEWDWERTAGAGASLPMGLFDNGMDGLKSRRRKVKNGTRIAAFSDGITEAESPSGELFGREELKTLLVQTRNLSPDQCHTEIIRAVKCWAGGLPEDAPDEEISGIQMGDDLTLAIVDVE